jgi:hypothetical protein
MGPKALALELGPVVLVGDQVGAPSADLHQTRVTNVIDLWFPERSNSKSSLSV